MNPITFTQPQRIEQRADGLYRFQYELHGLIEAINIVYCKTIKEAIAHAKSIIKKYIERLEMAARLSAVNSDSQAVNQEKKESGWNSVNWDPNKKKWVVKNSKKGKSWHVGEYKTCLAAVAAKKEDNVKHGLGKYNGKK